MPALSALEILSLCLSLSHQTSPPGLGCQGLLPLGMGPVNEVTCPALFQNRLWRKNKSSRPGIFCIGVDLNRNWNSGFGGTAA